MWYVVMNIIRYYY